MSRTQNVSDKRLDEALKLIREHCGENTSIITTPWDELTGEQIYDVMCADGHKALLDAAELYEHEEHHHHHHHDGETCSCGHHHHGHDADEVFTSWGIETARKFTEDDLRARLSQLDDQELYGIVLRAKGIVPEQDGTWLHFDMVPGEIELRHGAADYTGRLCVIGSGIKEDALAALFA